jgi:hypothetical protein
MAIMGLVCLLFVKEGRPREAGSEYVPQATSEYI